MFLYEYSQFKRPELAQIKLMTRKIPTHSCRANNSGWTEITFLTYFRCSRFSRSHCNIRSSDFLWGNSYVMFKTRAAVFYRDLKLRGAAEWFRPDKTRAASFFERLQIHS